MTKKIGILGGGQLARMMANAAQQMGMKAHIYAPESNSPAFDVTRFYTQSSYDDYEALRKFASEVDVITYEFENVPFECALFLENLKPLYPSSRALRISQDRLFEKDFIAGLGIKVAPYRDITSLADLEEAVRVLGKPSVLKTRRFGYDGKGQVKITDKTILKEAYASLKNTPCVLEGFVTFSAEVSVILARNPAGEIITYDLCLNEHKDHILHKTHVPYKNDAPSGVENEQSALDAAIKIAHALEYVGVLAVEMFLTDEGIIINELAPRVHNSGHWTLGGAVTSQFSQHIRAITGLPLGSTKRLGTIEMTNLINEDLADFENPSLIPVLYGKDEARTGRKMGHVTQIN